MWYTYNWGVSMSICSDSPHAAQCKTCVRHTPIRLLHLCWRHTVYIRSGSFDSDPSVSYLHRTDLGVCIISESHHSHRPGFIKSRQSQGICRCGSLALRLNQIVLFTYWQEICASKLLQHTQSTQYTHVCTHVSQFIGAEVINVLSLEFKE